MLVYIFHVSRYYSIALSLTIVFVDFAEFLPWIFPPCFCAPSTRVDISPPSHSPEMSLLSLDHSSDLDYIHKVLASYPDASLPPWFLENTIRALQQNSNLTDLNTQQETQEAIDQTLPLRLAELHARAEKAAVALAAKRKAIPNLIKKAEIMREKRKREVDEIATLKIDERKKQELERHEKEDVTEKMKSLGDIWTQIQKITENTEKVTRVSYWPKSRLVGYPAYATTLC